MQVVGDRVSENGMGAITGIWEQDLLQMTVVNPCPESELPSRDTSGYGLAVVVFCGEAAIAPHCVKQ